MVVEATEGGPECQVECALEKDGRDDDCRGDSCVSSLLVSRDWHKRKLSKEVGHDVIVDDERMIVGKESVCVSDNLACLTMVPTSRRRQLSPLYTTPDSSWGLTQPKTIRPWKTRVPLNRIKWTTWFKSASPNVMRAMVARALEGM